MVKKEKLLIPFAKLEDTCEPSKYADPQPSKGKEVHDTTVSPSSSTVLTDVAATMSQLELTSILNAIPR